MLLIATGRSSGLALLFFPSPDACIKVALKNSLSSRNRRFVILNLSKDTTHEPYSYGDSAGLSPASLFILRLMEETNCSANVGERGFRRRGKAAQIFYVTGFSNSVHLLLRRTLVRSEL